MGEIKVAYRVCIGEHRESVHQVDPDLEGTMITKWIFWRFAVGCPSSEYRQVANSCECDNETSDFINSGEFLSDPLGGIYSME